MSDGVADGALPAKARKKKRKAKPASDVTEPPKAGATRREEPTVAFAQSFPRDPELDRLVVLFEKGNYAAVRDGAPRLAHATASDDVRKAARELERRIETDPMAKVLLALGVALLVFLSYWYFSHPHVP